MLKNSMRPVHPGEVLREDYLVPLGMSANSLAKALNVPAPRINDIVRERYGLPTTRTCPSGCRPLEKRLAESNIDRKNVFLWKIGRAANFRVYSSPAAKYRNRQAFFGE